MDMMENETPDPARERALKAMVEAIVYVADEPATVEQIVAALDGFTPPEVERVLRSLVEEYRQADRGLEIREIAGGYKMFTKPEHHETIRRFVKNLTPPIKLSMAALETLATIAYRQPVTLPEIQEIRGVHAAGVLKTLLDKNLITTAGRKSVLGRPILYKTTKEFLIQFGLGSLQELPSIEEFEELARAALGEPPARPPERAEPTTAPSPPNSPPTVGPPGPEEGPAPEDASRRSLDDSDGA